MPASNLILMTLFIAGQIIPSPVGRPPTRGIRSSVPVLYRDNTRVIRKLRAATRENKEKLHLVAKDGNTPRWLAMIKAPHRTPFEGNFHQTSLTLSDGCQSSPQIPLSDAAFPSGNRLQ
jgi:hypothetical protein